MTEYARIASGVVAELFTPPAGFALTDCFHADVASQFVAVPDGVSPAQGWTYDGASFAAPVMPPPTPAQQAASLLAAGLAITCASVPAINGTFALDPTTMDQIGSVARDCAAGLGLPLGAPAFAYPDITGANKNFAPAQLQELYKALRDFIYAVDVTAKTLAAGGSASWPSAAVTIA
jgi:hypothetical protein